jgi:hypothetical protein
MGMPYSPSPFHKIIEAVSKVKTDRGLAALGIIAIVLCFMFSLAFSDGILKWVLSIMFGAGLILIIFVILLSKKEDEE